MRSEDSGVGGAQGAGGHLNHFWRHALEELRALGQLRAQEGGAVGEGGGVLTCPKMIGSESS